MNNIEAIKKAARDYDESIKLSVEQSNLTQRLSYMIKQHGIEAVSAASGLKISSLVQYTKNNPPKVSEATVKKAESVLSQF